MHFLIRTFICFSHSRSPWRHFVCGIAGFHPGGVVLGLCHLRFRSCDGRCAVSDVVWHQCMPAKTETGHQTFLHVENKRSLETGRQTFLHVENMRSLETGRQTFLHVENKRSLETALQTFQHVENKRSLTDSKAHNASK